MTNDTAHVSVMPQEVLSLLDVQAGDCIVDATLGMAGHSLKIAALLGQQGHLIGLDRDENSLVLARKRLDKIIPRLDLWYGSFSKLDDILASHGITKVNGILMDLGISSFQLDLPERGFSFLNDGPLDMRMDHQSPLTAEVIVNTFDAGQLERIFWTWGEERFARRFAQAIVQQRASNPFRTTKQLADFLLRALPGSYQRGRIHPATRCFQALRIAVNDELAALEKGLKAAMQMLAPGGRLVVISFHSLEDRIVKQTMQRWFDMELGIKLTKKPLVPSEEEMQMNSRSRSAKLRGFKKADV